MCFHFPLFCFYFHFPLHHNKKNSPSSLLTAGVAITFTFLCFDFTFTFLCFDFTFTFLCFTFTPCYIIIRKAVHHHYSQQVLLSLLIKVSLWDWRRSEPPLGNMVSLSQLFPIWQMHPLSLWLQLHYYGKFSKILSPFHYCWLFIISKFSWKWVELKLKSEEGDYLISQITDRVRNLIICHVSLMYLLLLEETRQWSTKCCLLSELEQGCENLLVGRRKSEN